MCMVRLLQAGAIKKVGNLLNQSVKWLHGVMVILMKIYFMRLLKLESGCLGVVVEQSKKLTVPFIKVFESVKFSV